MKAAVLKAFGSPLIVEDVPDPEIRGGEVIVDVVSARMLAYAGDVFSGARNYMLELPVIPGAGAVGRVRHAGGDTTKLKAGDWVLCDPTVRARDDLDAPDIILQGLTAATPQAAPLHRYYHDGAFAEQMRTPSENVTRIGDIADADAPSWSAVGTMLVPYGGLLAIDLKAGETLVVNGATGAFGSAAVGVGLGMGAGCVVATGRNVAALAELARRFGPRVRTVPMVGDEALDRAAILAAAPGPIDVVFDILPPAATAAQVRAAVLAVRPYGRVVLMGGVGMQGGADLGLPYPWLMRNGITVRGQWMYPPTAPGRLIRMIRAGLLDLGHYETTAFALADINAAVAHAAQHAGPFSATVVTP
jgi:alcohol dehydrogenase